MDGDWSGNGVKVGKSEDWFTHFLWKKVDVRLVATLWCIEQLNQSQSLVESEREGRG